MTNIKGAIQMVYELKPKVTHKFEQLAAGSVFALPKRPEALLLKVSRGSMAFGHRINATFEYIQAVSLFDGSPCLSPIGDADPVILVNGKFIEE
jgi:hypothetical protein